MENVAIIGASNKEDRYSYKALMLLKEYGHNVFPVNPAWNEIEGIKTYPTVEDIPERLDTITLYMNPQWLKKVLPGIIAKKPKRVIFNPGTESDELESALEAEGIRTLKACTLVMLRTGQYDKA